MSNRSIQINDVIVFNPESFEVARTSPQANHWIYCDGIKPWRGNQIPFIAIATFEDTPLSKDIDVLKPGESRWKTIEMPEWVYVPCDASSCMLVVEREGAYIKLMPLNEDFCPPNSIDKRWIASSVIEHGADVGILRVFP